MKIENTPVKVNVLEPLPNMEAFVKLIAKLNVGQSFVMPALPSNYRMALSILQTAFSAKYASRKCDGGIRVGRIE